MIRGGLISGILLMAVAVSGCVKPQPSPVVVLAPTRPAGVVEEIWEEPMVDVVDVPPGLDPEGHYYRPGHQEVVEIRQGRWKLHDKQ